MSHSISDTTIAGISQRGPSETALATATMRVLAAYDLRQEVRGRDSMAELFLPEERRMPLKDAVKRDWIIKNKVRPGVYEFMIARTAYFDQIVIEASSNKLPQLVLLGAGYDSRPYRFKDLLGNTVVYEVDAPATQLRKKQLLAQGGVQVPGNARFVAVDFDADDLEASLYAAGFSKNEKTLILWEGVAYYLSAETVDKVLFAIRSLCAPGSSICFDCALLSPNALSEDSIKKLRKQMKSKHSEEPIRFGIPEGMLEAFLAKRGFKIAEILKPAEMEARYLTLKDGTKIGKVPGIFAFVHASVV